MIKVYDTTNKKYYPFADYKQSLTNDEYLGEKRLISAIAEHTDGNAKFTCSAHGFVDGQIIIVSGTENYDDQYEVSVIDANTFTCEVTYVEDESAGEAYPVLDESFYITFLLDIEDIFDEVKLRTAYKAKSLKGGNDGGIVEEIPLTEDRRDVFMHFLKAGGENVFQKIQAYSKGIVNAYKFNQKIDLDGDGDLDGDDLYIHISINEDKDYQDENMYEILEGKIKDALVLYVLKEWYQLTSLAQDFQLNEIKYNETLADMKSVSMHAEGHKPIIFNEGFL